MALIYLQFQIQVCGFSQTAGQPALRHKWFFSLSLSLLANK